MTLFCAVLAFAMQLVVHPAFTPTEPQLRSAFVTHERLARERSRQYEFGQAKTVQVPVEGHDPLILSVVFMPPLEEAKKHGFEFGKVRGRSNSDRKAQIDPLVRRVREGKVDVRFEVILKVPEAVRQDTNTHLPEISFTLMNEEGVKLDPISPPTIDLPSPRDPFPDQVHNLLFPLKDKNTHDPLFTETMRKVRLTVRFGQIERQVEFDL